MASLGRLVAEMFARAMGIGILFAVMSLLVIGFLAQTGEFSRVVNAAGLLLLGGTGVLLARPTKQDTARGAYGPLARDANPLLTPIARGRIRR